MYNHKETGNNRNKEICDKYGKCEVYSDICKDEKFDKTHNKMMSKQVIKNYFKKFIKQDISFFCSMVDGWPYTIVLHMIRTNRTYTNNMSLNVACQWYDFFHKDCTNDLLVW